MRPSQMLFGWQQWRGMLSPSISCCQLSPSLGFKSCIFLLWDHNFSFMFKVALMGGRDGRQMLCCGLPIQDYFPLPWFPLFVTVVLVLVVTIATWIQTKKWPCCLIKDDRRISLIGTQSPSAVDKTTWPQCRFLCVTRLATPNWTRHHCHSTPYVPQRP